jgi:hypothetical protein
VAFSRDGDHVLSKGDFEGVRVWDGTPWDDKPPTNP